MRWEEVGLVVVWTVCWMILVWRPCNWMNQIEQVYETDCALRTKAGNEARIVRREHWRALIIQKCVMKTGNKYGGHALCILQPIYDENAKNAEYKAVTATGLFQRSLLRTRAKRVQQLYSLYRYKSTIYENPQSKYSERLQSMHSSLVHRLLRNADVMRGRRSMRVYGQRVLGEIDAVNERGVVCLDLMV